MFTLLYACANNKVGSKCKLEQMHSFSCLSGAATVDDERITVVEVEAPKPAIDVEENDALPAETSTKQNADTEDTALRRPIITEEMEQRANAELRGNYLRFLQQLTNKNVNVSIF